MGETVAVGAVIGIFVLLNLVTLTRSPSVWCDEVYFTDPAANLYFGKGFTSTAWDLREERFWAGNTPLYPLALFGWLELFGFDILQARSFNLFLMVLSVAAFWLTAVRARLIDSAGMRLVFVVLLLTGYGISYSYRNGRPDGITILLFAAAALAGTVQAAGVRSALLFGLATLFPLAGIQLAVFAALFCGLLVIFSRGRFIREAIAVGAGLVAGGLLLAALYSANGVLDWFMARHRGTSFLSAPLLERLRFLARNSLFSIDFSALVLMTLAAVLVLQIWRTRSPRNPVLLFGLAAGILIPVGMNVAGWYPKYYTWMAYVPLAVGVCSGMSSVWPTHGRLIRPFCVLMLLAACLVGLPARLAVSVLEWGKRDYAPVEEFVERTVGSQDRVFCDYTPYYPAKKRAAWIMLPDYCQVMSPEEKEKLTVLIIDPKDYDRFAKYVGDDWKPTGEELSPGGEGILPQEGFLSRLSAAETYTLRVYRRPRGW